MAKRRTPMNESSSSAFGWPLLAAESTPERPTATGMNGASWPVAEVHWSSADRALQPRRELP